MEKALSAMFIVAFAEIGFYIGGLSMAIVYGASWSTPARPAPLWTVLPPLGMAIIGALIGYRQVKRLG